MDQQLDAFMDLGPNVAPQRIAEATRAAIRTTSQRRAFWLARRFPIVNNYARLGLIAAAVLAVAIVGIGFFGRPTGVGPPSSPSASPSASAAAAANPLAGTWVAPEVTCTEEIATVEDAGYTAEQVTQAGFDPTCANGNIGTEVRDTNQYSVVFDNLPIGAAIRSLRTYDYGALNSPHVYRLKDATTFELGGHTGQAWEYCLTFHYTIVGDELTVDTIDPSCTGTGEASLNDQIALTAIFTTSSFTRQP